MSTKHPHSRQRQNTTCSWDGAIEEAERLISEARQRIGVLKFSIKTFEHLKAEGVAFPGGNTEQTSA